MGNDILNEDWIKTLQWDLPKTVPKLLAVNALKHADRRDQVAWLKHLLKLPAAQAMPSDVRKEVNAFIAGESETESPTA